MISSRINCRLLQFVRIQVKLLTHLLTDINLNVEDSWTLLSAHAFLTDIRLNGEDSWTLLREEKLTCAMCTYSRIHGTLPTRFLTDISFNVELPRTLFEQGILSNTTILEPASGFTCSYKPF